MSVPSQAETRAANLYHTYMRAFRKGASTGLIDKAAAEHENPEIRAMWERGYNDGIAARIEASRKMQEETGYTPSILRLAEGVDGAA